MSSNALSLAKAAPTAAEAPLKPLPRPGEYLDLVCRLFRSRAVLAVIGAGSGSRSAEACRGIAAELAASGHRVVIVPVESLLQTNPLPPATACVAGKVPNVWLWPDTPSAPVEFFQSCPTSPADSDWLAPLRREFDAVLLDCPSIDSEPAVPEIAALAEVAVLVVESGLTPKPKIQRDQRMLEIRGVKLAGCILMQRR
jgi:Mrp family chromosome partitioning ATPase